MCVCVGESGGRLHGLRGFLCCDNTRPYLSQVRDGLIPFIREVRARGKKPEDAWLRGQYDVDKQAELSKQVRHCSCGLAMLVVFACGRVRKKPRKGWKGHCRVCV